MLCGRTPARMLQTCAWLLDQTMREHMHHQIEHCSCLRLVLTYWATRGNHSDSALTSLKGYSSRNTSILYLLAATADLPAGQYHRALGRHQSL